MEPGEEVTEAAIREVKEETGLDFEPSTLLSIEAAGKILIVFKVYHYFSRPFNIVSEFKLLNQ